jgi:hypothetical protein
MTALRFRTGNPDLAPTCRCRDRERGEAAIAAWHRNDALKLVELGQRQSAHVLRVRPAPATAAHEHERRSSAAANVDAAVLARVLGDA